MSKLDYYNKEISNIQQQLLDKLDNLVNGLSQLSDTEIIQISKQIDFFEEMERLGLTKLLNKVGQSYDDEIALVFAELERRQLERIGSVSIATLQNLRDMELTYLTNGVRAYADQLKSALFRGIITGESNKLIIERLRRGFGVGTYISSSEASFLINDGFARFNSTIKAKAYQEFPETKFEYVGPFDDKTRDACRVALGKGALTRKEIDNLNIPKFEGFIGRGGYNCRHEWRKVFED